MKQSSPLIPAKASSWPRKRRNRTARAAETPHPDAPLVEIRAKELSIAPVIQGRHAKAAAFKEISGIVK